MYFQITPYLISGSLAIYCPIVMYGTPKTLSIICITPLTVPMSDSTTLALIPLAQTLISLVKEKREL